MGERYCLITNDGYGLYVGMVVSHDLAAKVVVARDVRHVARWFGRTGGITSLAVHGLCGPREAESRIGAAVPGESTLTGIKNVFPCTPEARASFERAVQS